MSVDWLDIIDDESLLLLHDIVYNSNMGILAPAHDVVYNAVREEFERRHGDDE